MNLNLRKYLVKGLALTGLFISLSFQVRAQYCTPIYTTGTGDNDWIDGVVLNTISNLGTGGSITDIGYSDYSYLSTDLTDGVDYTLSITDGSVYGEYYQAWVDYNQDYIFEESEMVVPNTYITLGSTTDFTINIPGYALDGPTRLRIRMEYSTGSFDACESLTFGEAEDYTVNLSGGGGAITGCTDPTALNYNPDATVDDGSCLYGYTISSCDYDPMTTDGTVLCLGDDQVSSAVPLGFTFHFYDADFTQCYICSNGYMTFTSGTGSACCSGAVLPSTLYPYSIFFAQEDLDPNTCVDGTISYYTTGDPGSQIFVMSFVDVPHYPGPTGTYNVTCQVQLYEATGEIRIVTTEYNSDGGLSTMGLNWNGSYAQPVDGRNSQDWSAYNECISFIPGGAEACSDVAPADEYADAVTSSSATLHWDVVSGADQYVVSLYNVSAGLAPSKKHLTTNFVSLNTLSPETEYGFRVKTVCYTEGTISPYSDWYYFTTGPLREGQFSPNVSLYPNPSNGDFNLNINGYDFAQFNIHIVNSLGQVVYQDVLHVDNPAYVTTIHLNNATPGIYQVQLVNGEKVMTYPVVISK